MYRPFKTTVKFATDDAQEIRLEYLVSAKSSTEAKSELERRLLGQEVFGYIVEKVVAATKQEAAFFRLPVFSYWASRSIQRRRMVLVQGAFGPT
jgi:hypothetical protein